MTERTIFTTATTVALVHGLDDALVARGPGVAVGQHAPAAVVATTVAVGALVAFPRLRPGLRSGVALVLGILALVNGAMHVAHVVVDEPGAGALTGVLAAAAGAVLVALGVAIPFGHR